MESLIPDFKGEKKNIDRLLAVAPEIISHNMETVKRLTRKVRIQARYERSLELLAYMKEQGQKRTKTGIMLGLGETEGEVLEAMRDLREAQVDILTLGQYLQPTKHLPVAEFIAPEQFERLKKKDPGVQVCGEWAPRAVLLPRRKTPLLDKLSTAKDRLRGCILVIGKISIHRAMRTQKMKTLSGLAAIAIGGLIFWNNSGQDETVYTPRAQKQEVKDEAKGAAAWLHALRANQTTGEIDPRDVLAARASIEQKRNSYKTSALNLQWQEMGPMNIGGRTRTLFIDPDNPSTIFTGSVSGGLFRSTTAGSSWQLVNGDASNQAITGITKTVNGDYYVCTGEGLHYGAFGRGGGRYAGGGIFKSTDGGNTFSVLQATVPTAIHARLNMPPCLHLCRSQYPGSCICGHQQRNAPHRRWWSDLGESS